MVDRYSSFAQLERGETKGVDYDIRTVRRPSPVAIIAPHGGEIEPGTTSIAEATAGSTFNFYSFIGLKPGRPHGDLHIASTSFDEPKCCAIVENCDIVVAVHGRADRNDPKTVWLGGRFISLRDAIAAALSKASFVAHAVDGQLAGTASSNICNRGTRAAGVQLELPRSLRDELQKYPTRLFEFSNVIRSAIKSVN